MQDLYTGLAGKERSGSRATEIEEKRAAILGTVQHPQYHPMFSTLNTTLCDSEIHNTTVFQTPELKNLLQKNTIRNCGWTSCPQTSLFLRMHESHMYMPTLVSQDCEENIVTFGKSYNDVSDVFAGCESI